MTTETETTTIELALTAEHLGTDATATEVERVEDLFRDLLPSVLPGVELLLVAARPRLITAYAGQRRDREVEEQAEQLLTQIIEGHHGPWTDALPMWEAHCDGGDEQEIEAATASEAAREYVDGGDWGELTSTTWIDVYCSPLDADGEPDEDERERVTITLEPTEPDCIRGHEHDWQSPISVVGGIESNPGVQGHGGGVTILEVCRHCGRYRETDTWAQRRDTGEQGLRSVEYRDADGDSEEWIRERDRADEDAALDAAEGDDLRELASETYGVDAEPDDTDELIRSRVRATY